MTEPTPSNLPCCIVEIWFGVHHQICRYLLVSWRPLTVIVDLIFVGASSSSSQSSKASPGSSLISGLRVVINPSLWSLAVLFFVAGTTRIIAKSTNRFSLHCALSGHNLRDRSECVNVIGVISEPFAVNRRKWIVIVCVICDWNEPLASRHHSPPFLRFLCVSAFTDLLLRWSTPTDMWMEEHSLEPFAVNSECTCEGLHSPEFSE